MPGLIADKARKPTKNEQRRAKKKQQKLEANNAPAPDPAPSGPVADPPSHPTRDETVTVEVEELSATNPVFAEYAKIAAKFQQPPEEEHAVKEPVKRDVFFGDDDEIQDEDEEEETKQKLNRKARKKAEKFSVAELKAMVRKPELVEWNDIDAREPKMLINIKMARNVIPVPRHWSLKREYLSSKRGIEKQHWILPKFIAETGVAEMRDAVLEKQENATMKQKQRDRVQGKTGSLSLDYNKLYEAFFRRQTKPELTRYGEVYYEGKEYEVNLQHLKPGQLSDDLRQALNMGTGTPPPWLLNQQRHGPPPSYPALKIPGVNAPIPPYGDWGFQPGSWGRAPVDEKGNPLWGGNLYEHDDAQAAAKRAADQREAQILIPKEINLWAELKTVPDEDEEEEAEQVEQDEQAEDAGVETGKMTGVESYGRSEPTSKASTAPTTDFLPGPDNFDLRKQRPGTETELSSTMPRSAGQVLNQRSIRAEGFFGGERAYDLSGAQASPDVPMLGAKSDNRGQKRKADDLDVSIDVDQIESGENLTKEQLRQLHDDNRAQSGGWRDGGVQEDFSGMVAEETAKRQKRDQEREKKGRK